MKKTTLTSRVITITFASALLSGCNSTRGQADTSQLSAHITPTDQVQRYKLFFEKIKQAIDENRIGDSKYLEQLLELEISGARPRIRPAESAKFPPGMKAYYETDVASNEPVFKYRSRRIVFPELNAATCIRYEFMESIFGKGFRPPPYGQPHINWSPGSVPPTPKGTYAGLIGIFKEVKNNPVTQISLGFDFNGCTDAFIVRQAIN
jgi:hypothetical protein